MAWEPSISAGFVEVLQVFIRGWVKISAYRPVKSAREVSELQPQGHKGEEIYFWDVLEDGAWLWGHGNKHSDKTNEA